MQQKTISDDARKRIQAIINRIKQDHTHFIGFPAALDFSYEELKPTLDLLINNVGDPYVDSWHGVNTRDIEREVIAFFAKLFRAPEHAYWGYVTNGSTECNLYAAYVAREKYPNAIVYHSKAAHYGVPKNCHILGLQAVAVDTQPSGEMDYDSLRAALIAHSDRPAIVIATVGTTMTEARDNVATIRGVLQSLSASEAFVHVDAALAGPYAALLEPRHPFDFADGADSISISGHKFLGSPIPCGVVLVKKADKERLGAQANYTGSIDTTISGSRNGHTPLILWYALQRWGLDGLKERAEASQLMAAYLYECLQAIEWQTWRNPQALTVMLKSPAESLVRKWQLATDDSGWSHIICMPHVTKWHIDTFVEELLQSRRRAAVATPKRIGIAG